MSILKVARMGHPVLRARAQAIDPADIKSPRIQQLIDDMFETMNEYHGVGLAAPQVHAGVRLFVAGFPSKGLPFKTMAIDIHQFKDGKVIKTWHIENWLGALFQMGAFAK